MIQQVYSRRRREVNSIDIVKRAGKKILQCQPSLGLQFVNHCQQDIRLSEPERIAQFLTIVTCPEVVAHHAPHDHFDVSRVRLTSNGVNLRLVDLVIRGMRCLQYVQRATHVPAGELQERSLASRRDVNPKNNCSA